MEKIYKIEDKINRFLALEFAKKYGNGKFIMKFVQVSSIVNPRTMKKIANSTTISGSSLAELKLNLRIVKDNQYLIYLNYKPYG